MNSKRILIAFSIAGVLYCSSCKKDSMSSGTTTTADETTATTTVAATITNTGTYTYTLPSGNYTVTTQASHASASNVASGNAGATAYTYVPAADFTGTDTVIVSPADTMGMPGGICQAAAIITTQLPAGK